MTALDQIDRAACLRWLSLLHPAGEIVELRVRGARRPGWRGKPIVISGYFDDPARLMAAAHALDEARVTYEAANPTLNPAIRDCFARAPNVLRDSPEHCTSARQIERRKALLLDVDARRPVPDVMASAAQRAAAMERANEIRAALQALGWPDPLALDSGNGCHLVYGIDLPTADGGLVERVLRGVAARFDDEGATLDTACHNPDRLCKLPGSWCRKGADAAAHRLAVPLHIPEALLVVTEAQLLEVAAWAPVDTRSNGKVRQARGATGQPFNVSAFIARHSLTVSKASEWEGGYRWEFEACPFDSEHRRTAAIVQVASGAVSATCRKASCTLTWQNLRERLEPAADRQRPRVARPDREVSDAERAADEAREERLALQLNGSTNGHDTCRETGVVGGQDPPDSGGRGRLPS